MYFLEKNSNLVVETKYPYINNGHLLKPIKKKQIHN